LCAEGEGIRLKVPAALSNRIGAYAGKPVTIGIRPEDMRIARDTDPSELNIPAVVEVVERLGSEILLDVAVGPVTMVASVEPTVTAKVHEQLQLAVNPERMHFFDSETEAAI
jgi:multiple sugar transport system ATP-binding protein